MMTETKVPQLTAMEKQTLVALLANLYAEPGFSDVTPSDLSKITTIPMNSLRGVLSSLVQKGLVWMEDDRGPMVVYLASKHYHLHPTWGANIRRLANCVKTYYEAGGHGKAQNNERRANELRRELERQGIAIPSVDELLAIGICNGEGSY